MSSGSSSTIILTCPISYCDWKYKSLFGVEKSFQLINIHIDHEHTNQPCVVSSIMKSSKLSPPNCSGNNTDIPPVVAIKLLERMAVIPASKRITRVELMKMSQGNDEPIRTFAAKVQNKAKICGFQMQSKCSCDLTIDYTQEVVKDVILAGIADNEIRMDILEVKGIEEKSIDDIVALIEQKESGMKIYGSSEVSTMSSINHSQLQVVSSSNLVPITSNNVLIRSCDEDDTDVPGEQTSHATTSKLVCDGESSSSNNSNEEMETNETGHSLGGDGQKKIQMKNQQLQEQQVQQLVQYLTSASNQVGIFAQHQPNLLGANDQHQLNLLGANNQHQPNLLGANNQVQLNLLGANNQHQPNQESNKMDERPHKYPQSPKHYVNSKTLTTHRNVHGKYRCPTCNRLFSRLDHLRTHQYTHFKEKTFKCPKCPVANYFRTPNQLSTHMVRHKKVKQHECSICHKKFHRSSHLKVHKRIHTKVKPYECDICKKRFSQSGSLKSHIRVHTGEKPYECEFCHKSFTTSSGRTSHLKHCTWMEKDNTIVSSVQTNTQISDQHQSNLLGANNQHQSSLLGANNQHQSSLLGANNQHQPSLLGANNQHQPSLLGANNQHQSSLLGANNQHQSSLLGANNQHQSNLLGANTNSQHQSNLLGANDLLWLSTLW